jgi:hypothetical protein
VTAAVALVLGVPPAQATTTITVNSVVRSQVGLTEAPGAILSIIHVCPTGSVLNRRLTRALIAPTPPGYRLLSRELWPRGMVTRWRLGGARVKGDNPPLPTQTVACAQTVSAGATRHTATISVTMRVWGPGPVKAALQSWHDPSGSWNGKPAKATIGVRRFTSQRMVYPTADSDFPDEAYADGYFGGSYPAGQYAELKVWLSVTVPRP